MSRPRRLSSRRRRTPAVSDVHVSPAAGHGRECDAAFEAGQAGADAEVGAAAEGQVRVGRAGDVESVRVAVDVGVAVGRANHGEGKRAGGYDGARHGDVFAGDTRVGLHRRVVAQQLLHRAGRVPVRVAAQQGPLVGVAGEGKQAVADQIGGGLVPGDEHQHNHGDELVVVTQPTGGLGGQKCGQQTGRVAVGARPPPGHHVGEVARQLCDGVGRRGGLPAAQRGFDGQRGSVRPAGQVSQILLGQAEQGQDHPDRQRPGEGGHQVHRTVGVRRCLVGVVDQLGGDGADRVDHRGGGAGSERAADHIAQPDMICAVEVEHEPGRRTLQNTVGDVRAYLLPL